MKNMKVLSVVLTLVLALAGAVSAANKTTKNKKKSTQQCTEAMAEHCTKEMAAKCPMKDEQTAKVVTTENGTENSSAKSDEGSMTESNCCKTDKKIARQKNRRVKVKSVTSTSCCDGGSCCFPGSACCTTHKA